MVQSLSNADEFNATYEKCNPTLENRYSFRFSEVEKHYYEWPKLTEFCAIAPSNGLMEKRGGALIDIDRDALEQRMRAYLDPELSWDSYAALNYGLVKPQASFEPKIVRRKALLKGQFNPSSLVRYALRPFDIRWCYYTGVSGVWNSSRPSLWKQCWSGNSFLMTRPAGVASPEGCPFFFTGLLGDNDFLRGHAYYFPLQLMNGARLRPKEQLSLLDLLPEKPEVDRPFANLSQRPFANLSQRPFANLSQQPFANLSQAARDYLAQLKLPNPDKNKKTASLIWMHALAIGYSPDYLKENADGIRQDFPRIPLPRTRQLLIDSANLGQQIAALLDTETQVSGVTSGKIRAELKGVAVISRVGGGQLNPDTDLALKANWGYAGAKGVTMPGKGKISDRPYTHDELLRLDQEAMELLGKETHDIYLNDVAYWKNIPTRVWDYTIGGYQVIKKWLSYREEDGVLDRPLKREEINEVRDMARRIAAILLQQPKLNVNYEAVKQTTYSTYHDS